MKTKNLITVLSSVILLAAASVYADENKDVKYNINNQNLSKRPYVESKKDNFEGATLIQEQVEEDKKHKPMRLHMLGRQPYAVKNSE